MKNANNYKRRRAFYFIGGIVFVLLVLIVAYIFSKTFLFSRPVSFGVTFSAPHARYLGLDAWGTYTGMLDDLGVRLIRLPIYWNETESTKGQFDWAETDFFMDEAAKRGAKITLAIGQKVPRWPECHIPKYAQAEFGTEAYGNDLLRFMETAVNRYKNHPALLRYQVENEPLFAFGECPKLDTALFRREVSMVRSLDPGHDIQLTVSGEGEAWIDLVRMADVIGVSMYKIVRNKLVGPIIYPQPAAWYAIERQTIALWVKDSVVSELQAEPWFDNGLIPPNTKDAYMAFPVDRLRDHVIFARRTGFSEVYLWGVEWWYYLKAHGDSRLFDEARTIFSPL